MFSRRIRWFCLSICSSILWSRYRKGNNSEVWERLTRQETNLEAPEPSTARRRAFRREDGLEKVRDAIKPKFSWKKSQSFLPPVYDSIDHNLNIWRCFLTLQARWSWKGTDSSRYHVNGPFEWSRKVSMKGTEIGTVKLPRALTNMFRMVMWVCWRLISSYI